MRPLAALRVLALGAWLTACSIGGTAQSDSSPPQMAITAPVNGAVVSGQVEILVLAIDDFGVDRVRILVDGVILADVFTAPYRVVWNTITLPDNSAHIIRAEASDLAGNTSSQQIGVTVLNGPQ
jgi:hypothetical protein